MPRHDHGGTGGVALGLALLLSAGGCAGALEPPAGPMAALPHATEAQDASRGRASPVATTDGSDVGAPAKATPHAAAEGSPPTAPADAAEDAWQTLRPGLERREIVDPEAGFERSMVVYRVEPDRFEFGVAYEPGAPQSLWDWQRETQALVVVNGGFFDEGNRATGLVIEEGVAQGQSYVTFGGMFAVTAQGPVLRWLPQTPYDAAEPLVAAVQSFPMLLRPGGQTGFDEDSGLRSRRTVIAQDRQGRILLVLAPGGGFTLHEMAVQLAGSDLDVDAALNLDGGSSSGLVLADPAQEIPALVKLPAVITIHARGEG